MSEIHCEDKGRGWGEYKSRLERRVDRGLVQPLPQGTRELWRKWGEVWLRMALKKHPWPLGKEWSGGCRNWDWAQLGGVAAVEVGNKEGRVRAVGVCRQRGANAEWLRFHSLKGQGREGVVNVTLDHDGGKYSPSSHPYLQLQGTLSPPARVFCPGFSLSLLSPTTLFRAAPMSTLHPHILHPHVLAVC